MKTTAKKSETKNSMTATGEYYDGKIETIDYLEFLMDALVSNGIAPWRAYDVVAAVKYLSPRLGAKADQPIELDLMKAENYIHRARTGNWLDKKFLNPFEGGQDVHGVASAFCRWRTPHIEGRSKYLKKKSYHP